MIDFPRFAASPLGRAALASVLALAALSSAALSRDLRAAPGVVPVVLASPVGLSGELA